MNCFGCGAEKDPAKNELYPYAEDGIATEKPVQSLFVLDCQGPKIPGHPQGHSEFRMAVVCHACFHRLTPDMWISEAQWRGVTPVVSYERLPVLTSETANNRWDPTSFAHIRVTS